MTVLVRTVGVSKQYPSGGTVVRAISDASLLIENGEFVAIRGRSGSGKSTLLNLLGLLDRPDCGEYALAGRPVANLTEDVRAAIRNREIGFVFQNPILLPRIDAVENVELPLLYRGMSRSERRRRAEIALERVGLAPRAHHLPNQLSGGEQQRVVIARAIVAEPALVLADEPTGALDSRTSAEILSLFEEMHQHGRTVIVVTHAADVAERARRHVTLCDGQIVADERVGTRPVADAAVADATR